MLFAFGLERSKHKYNLTFARTKNCLLLSPESERIVYLIWSMFDMVNFCHAIANIKKYEKLNTMRKKLSKFWSINHRQRHYAHLFVQFRNSGLGETLPFCTVFWKISWVHIYKTMKLLSISIFLMLFHEGISGKDQHSCSIYQKTFFIRSLIV